MGKSTDPTDHPVVKPTVIPSPEYLVGGAITILKKNEKYELVNGVGMTSHILWKIIQSCLKPPTRYILD